MAQKTFGKVIFAAIAGAVAGLLLAPKSGKETREDLKVKALDAKKKAAHKADLVKDVTKENAAEVKETMRRAAKEAAELGEEAKLRASRVAEDAKRTAAQVDKNVRAEFKADKTDKTPRE